jgi:hypothetical protein
MQLEITHVDRDKGMRYESYSLPLEATALKGLFRRLSREFGRCASKVYVGEGNPIGWVFEKKTTLCRQRLFHPRNLGNNQCKHLTFTMLKASQSAPYTSITPRAG